MSDDLVRDFGYLTLGSRFKRLGERMQSDVQRLSAAHGFELHGALWTMLFAIQRGGPIAVGELAQSLGIAQPGVTRSLAQLESRGLVRRLKPGADQRVKRVALTEQGQKVFDHSRRVLWPLVQRAVAEVCDGLDGSILEQLTRIEEALARQPLDQRTRTEDDA
jgi:DNA-binding MarR family transcriptional regulator